MKMCEGECNYKSTLP